MLKYNSQKLYEELRQIPVIDTHEHLMYDERKELKEYDDVLQLYLWQYLKSDLISAGLSERELSDAVNPEIDLMQRWKTVEPYWDACRFTGYARSLDYAVRKIYGVESITGDTIELLSRKFREANHCGHTKHVLKDLCGIEISCVDLGTAVMPEKNPLFHNVWQPTAYISPKEEQWAEVLACHDLADWCDAAEEAMHKALRCNNSRIVKLIFAYERTLQVEKIEEQDAGTLFQQAQQGKTMEFPKLLQDYMIHFVLREAAKQGWTVQIHTGHLEGNCGNINDSDPSLLVPLFESYPGVRFDVFHIGYPFEKKLISVCKSFPNVFADMCWAHILSPAASRSFLLEFLQCVPYTKLSAFGGDYFFVDGVCGHLELCRQNVAAVLSECIENGLFTVRDALRVAQAVFYDNPKRILQI